MIAFNLNAQDIGFRTDSRIDRPGDKTGRFITDNSGGSLSQAYLFRDIDLSAYDLLAANLSFSEKDQVQKINFQPFKLIPTSGIFLNSFKLNIVQKKDITTFGIGLGMDYSDPMSGRSIRILDNVFGNQPAGPLNSDPDTTSFIKLRQDIAEANLPTNTKTALIKSLVDDEIKKLQEKHQAVFLKKLDSFRVKVLDSLLLRYDEKRAASVFKWTLGYNTQLFSILSAKGDANDFDSKNYHSTKANIASLIASYSYKNGCVSLSTSYNYIQSRKDAVEGSKAVHYDGFSFSAAKRLYTFLEPEKLRKNTAYKKSLFVPSIILGCSWELKTTKEKNFILIEEGIKRARALTFFVDILIAPAAQFRVALPFQKSQLVDGSKMSYLGANVQYTLKFSSLN